ncbi:MAG: queuosine precursor transporter [Chloroflexi bacterium]|nr:queuosine precursor transporter [Chloroflexota bacterium]
MGPRGQECANDNAERGWTKVNSGSGTHEYKYLDIITALFVTVLLLSNLLSSAKIIDLGTSIGSIALIFDAGTLVFPISYIFGDILTEIYGYRRSRRVIWMGFVATALLGFFVWLAGILPGDSFWQQTVGQGAYDAILGGVSGLVVASLAAFFLGEFCNSYVLAKMKVASQGRLVWARTIGSTLVGQAVDTVAFFLIAAALGVFPIEILASLILTNYLFKVGIEVLFTPVTVRIIAWVKRAEREDVYDTDTDFNPFHLTS